ncbi:MAG: chemotaxis signal relay system purine-binding protiein CheW [Rhodobacteraceae bacterium HLUCCA08]|nr:MAG: chemotaxis signal relay system purine-binding protiein CheW [Rhodobacteraceae bacterium HLUCCA08]
MADETPDLPAPTEREYITFTVADQHYCLDIQQIREIRRWTPVTPLPHAAHGVLGVMNLRGAVIPIYDMAARLGLGDTQPSERDVVIVAALDSTSIGLLVESVCEILTVKTDEIQPTPDVRSDATREAIRGVIAMDGQMTRILELGFIADRSPVAA